MFKFLSKEDARIAMNKLGETETPFLFFFDYENTKHFVAPLSEVNKADVQYSIGQWSNTHLFPTRKKIQWKVTPQSFSNYQIAFNHVMDNLKGGNSYLLNLTSRSEIATNYSLFELYAVTQAPYKLWVNNLFTCFSPECFVKIKNQIISSYPMKGTISTRCENAQTVLLNNPKEQAEHATIVDLIRNDLSMVAANVVVDKYRYVEEIETIDDNLYATSSCIKGQLPTNWNAVLGDILFCLLPAGSICGAPKKETCRIIKNVESHSRGFYTGVFGIYQNNQLDSAVMIRFVANEAEKLFFFSGGGITAQSIADDEYSEMILKTNVPIKENNV